LKILIVDNVENKNYRINRHINYLITKLNLFYNQRTNVVLIKSFEKAKASLLDINNDYDYVFLGTDLPRKDNQKNIIKNITLSLLDIMIENNLNYPVVVFCDSINILNKQYKNYKLVIACFEKNAILGENLKEVLLNNKNKELKINEKARKQYVKKRNIY